MTSASERVLTPGQQAQLNKIPELADSVFPQVRDTIPSANYVDPARFELEKRDVFGRIPVAAGPSGLLPEPKTYFQLDITGMPVLLTRAADGKARAFANVCRHRGMRLCVETEPTKASRITCPYHAWTFALDGQLVGLPREETFPGIDKKTLSLTELPSLEAGGVIWVGLDPNNPPDFSLVSGELEADLNAIGFDQKHIFDRMTFKVNANWKLVMDGMLDSYHVTRLHKDSVARFFVDTENVIDRIGAHIRVWAARGNFERKHVSPQTHYNDIRKSVVISYILFPNSMIIGSPDFVSMGVMRPIATDRTEVDYYLLADSANLDEKLAGKLRRSFDLMGVVFGKEDYWAAEMCDSGLRAGTMKEVQLGGMEVQIRMFQDAISACIDKAKA